MQRASDKADALFRRGTGNTNTILGHKWRTNGDCIFNFWMGRQVKK